MVGWHHQHKGHEFEQALGDGEGQEGLERCNPWDHKELDMTEQLNTITTTSVVEQIGLSASAVKNVR